MKVIVLLMLVFTAGCASRGPVVIDGSRGRAIDVDEVEWTDEELAREVSPLEVRRGNWSSEHLIRLAGAEKPHVHERHDLTVTLLRGRVAMHIGDQVFVMKPGDVATVPHGAIHWARNLVHGGASVAHALFCPPNDGQDTVPVR